ncbi:MAG: hypothetical protein PARBA_02501 [Parabacteroides sp.]
MNNFFCVFISCLLVFLSYSNERLDRNSIGILNMHYLLSYNLEDSTLAKQTWEEMHAISTLQGIVNKDKPLFYLKYVMENDINVDQYWWDKYRQKGKWLFGRDTFQLKNVDEAICYYKDMINGVVVYDPKIPSTSNVASSICGIENLIAIRYDESPSSLYSRVVLGGPKLPVKVWLVNRDGSSMFVGEGRIPDTNIPSSLSQKNDPYLWFIDKYMKSGKCSSEYGAYYIDQKWLDNPTAVINNHHTLSNHDFFVSKKAFFFDLSPWGDEPATDDPGQPLGTDLNTLKLFLKTAYELNGGKKMCYIGGFPSWAFKYTDEPGIGGKHWAVGTEWEFSRIISSYNAFKDADAIGFGSLANASFWTHYPLKEFYTQKKVSEQDLMNKGYLDAEGKICFNGRKFIIFYVGDYDASSWVAQRTPSIWDDPNRGTVPMMWAISPVLENRVPMALEYYRETATDNDFFVAADNGAGYLMPGMLQEPREISGLKSGLDAWAEHCKKYYSRWDLSITGFIIDGSAPGLSEEGLKCYASFSPDGIVPQKVPLTFLYEDMPILRSDDDVVEDDPVLAAKHVVRKVKERPIPFHWFRNILKTPTWYMSVVSEIRRLDPSIELLDAPTFFLLYKKYLQENQDAANGKIN